MRKPLAPQNYRFNLTAANPSFPIRRPVRFLRCLASSEAFTLVIDGEELPFRTGQFVELPADFEPFEYVQLRRAASAALANNYVEIIGADFLFGDDALTFAGAINITPGAIIRPQVAIALSNGAIDFNLLGGNNVQIFTANPDVESVDVFNRSTTTEVRLATDPANLGDNRGLMVPPRTSRTVRMNGNLYARAVSAAASVSVNWTSFA